MNVTDQDGNAVTRVSISLTVGEAKWLLDRLEDQLEEYPDASDAVREDVVRLSFLTNDDA
jgi:hypothetical protein